MAANSLKDARAALLADTALAGCGVRPRAGGSSRRGARRGVHRRRGRESPGGPGGARLLRAPRAVSRAPTSTSCSCTMFAAASATWSRISPNAAGTRCGMPDSSPVTARRAGQGFDGARRRGPRRTDAILDGGPCGRHGADRRSRREGSPARGPRRGTRMLTQLADAAELRRLRPGLVSEMLEPDVKDGGGGLRDLQHVDVGRLRARCRRVRRPRAPWLRIRVRCCRDSRHSATGCSMSRVALHARRRADAPIDSRSRSNPRSRTCSGSPTPTR